jgi:hypothetical protein
MEMDRCTDLREHFVGYVTGVTERVTDLRIQLHLSEGCATCAGELEALQAAFQRVPLGFPPQPLVPGGGEAVAKKIASSSQELREVPIVYPETNERKLAWTLVILFGVALAAAAFWGRYQVVELDQARGKAAFEAAQTRRVAGDHAELRDRANRIESHLLALTDPRVSTHDFPPAADGARMRAFVHLEAGALTLSFHGFADPAEGQTLALWWGADDRWTRIGEVPPHDGGAAFVLPEGAALPARLQVTSEPADVEAPAPTGPTLIGGVLVPGEAWAKPELPERPEPTEP